MTKPSNDNTNDNRFFHFIKITVLLIIPLILVLLPASFFDTGQSLCLSKLLLNMNCYACGMTRAFQHFLHLNFAVAMQYNKLIIVVFPLLIGLWGQALFKELRLVGLI